MANKRVSYVWMFLSKGVLHFSFKVYELWVFLKLQVKNIREKGLIFGLRNVVFWIVRKIDLMVTYWTKKNMSHFCLL